MGQSGDYFIKKSSKHLCSTKIRLNIELGRLFLNHLFNYNYASNAGMLELPADSPSRIIG